MKQNQVFLSSDDNIVTELLEVQLSDKRCRPTRSKGSNDCRGVSNVDNVSDVLATCRGRRQTLVIDDILFALSCCMLLIKPSRDLNPTRHLFLQTNYGSSICNQFPSEYWILRQWTFHYSAHFCLAHGCEEWRYTFMMLALMFPRWRHFPFSTNSVIDTWIARYWFPLLNPVDRWLSSTSSPSADIRWS